VEFKGLAQKKKQLMFKQQVITLILGAVLMSATAFAQEDYTADKSDASVQALGSFVKQTTLDGIKQDATNSSGVLATQNRPPTHAPIGTRAEGREDTEDE
jgi:hypothetical protein